MSVTHFGINNFNLPETICHLGQLPVGSLNMVNMHTN